MKSNITKMITMCMCLIVVGFASQKGQQPIAIVAQEDVQAKTDAYNQSKEEHATNFDGPMLWDRITVAPSDGNRDGTVTFDYCTDYYGSESYFILLDTVNWWAWGSDGWVGPMASYECGSWSATVPAGNYLLIAGDSYGDGGLYGDVSVNGDYVGSVATAWGDAQSPYSGLYEAAFGFDVTDAPAGGASTVSFEINTPDDCDWVGLTGTWDNWSGWGLNYGDGITSLELEDGNYEFVILCAQGAGWWYDIWASSIVYHAPVGGDCWNGVDEPYNNYAFTVAGSDITVAVCGDTCDAECPCDGESLTLNMVDSWGDGWNGNQFCINDECATLDSGSSGSYDFCVDLSASNDVTCGGGSYTSEVSWTLNAADGSEVLAGGAPYSGCLGDCGVGGCMVEGSDNYNPDATFDDGTCNAYIGMDCAYFGSPDAIVDCDLYYCVPTSWLGDGGCDSYYFACEELGCDGGDCADCAGDCLGSASEDICGTCNGDCAEVGGSCSDTDNGAVDSYGDGCDGYTMYPSWCGGYDDADFNSMTMCCACGGGDATAGSISCGDGSCDCDGSVPDCAGECGGSAALDDCGVCNGGNADMDCAGECGGAATVDNCGTCDSDSSNDCAADCAGVFGGDSAEDCSGNCVAGWLFSYLGDGWCDGSDAPYGIDLSCYDCDNGDCASDCNGDCEGTAELDFCGVCGGDNVAIECEDDGDGGGDDGGCLTVFMVDSYGDGWNGNVLTIGDESFTLESGASGGASYCGPSDVAVTCGGGSWMGEVSWEISDGSGNVLLAGGAPFDGCLGTCDDGDDGGEECVDTDNGAVDSYGDGCDGYTMYPSWCGGYDDDDFNSLEMCCACQSESTNDDDVVYSEYSANKLVELREYDIAQQYRIDNPIATPDISRDGDCGSGPDVGCDGVCFSGLEDIGCGCGEDLNDAGCCDDLTPDCFGECGGTAVEDCSGDGGCFSAGWVGDGYCDGAAQAYGADLSCYDCDGGDCASDCNGVCEGTDTVDCNGDCGDSGLEFDFCGVCGGDNACEVVSDDACVDTYCGHLIFHDGIDDCAFIEENSDYDCSACEAEGFCGGGGSEACSDCEFDFTAYGSECCDTAAEEFGLDCATLEGVYFWDCSGCNCPLDGDEPEGCDPDTQFDCGDGQCIPASYFCDGSNEFCNASWGPDCSNGADEGLDTCGYEDACEMSNADACAAAEGYYCGDDESNWTSYSPNGCVPSYYICDGWDDCVDGSDESCGRSADSNNLTKPMLYGSDDAKLMLVRIADQWKTEFDVANASRDTACDGSWSGSDFGCDGVCFSGLENDECGDCGGDGIDEGFCDCDGGIDDCADEDCVTGGWVGDGYCDGTDQAYGADLTCYDCDGGDCMLTCGCEDDDSCRDCCGVAYGDNSTCGSTGDVNFDSSVDVLDVVDIVADILETSLLSECEANEADITGDSSINVLDVIQVVELILSGYSFGCTDEAADNYDSEADADDGSCIYPCPDGTVADCDGSGECFSEGWVGDGLCDGADQNWGADLTCYENDGGDCDQCGSYVCPAVCGDGNCDGDEADTCPEDCQSSEACSDCEYDFTNYGSECCDTAAEEYGIDCALLESYYGWDCSGCNCPLDSTSCSDTDCGYWLNYGYTCDILSGTYGIDCSACDDEGACGGDEPEGCDPDTQFDCGDGQCIPASYFCDGSNEFCNASWGPDCSNGADEGLDTCGYEDACEMSNADACAAAEGYYCGDDESNWTSYSPNGCVPSYYICDGWDDCVDGSDETCDGRAADSEFINLKKMQNKDTDKRPMMLNDEKNPANVIKSSAPLGRKAAVFESKLQRAESVKLIQTSEGLSYEADGYVGFEITLEHGADFTINVTESCFIADYATTGNTTKVIVVGPETENIFSSTGDYEIVDIIAGTAGGTALNADIVSIPTVFGLSDAYPNPFNPTTSVELAMPHDGFVSVKIYNLMGQVVSTLHEGDLTANSYMFTWDAANVASGMYFLKAEAAGNMDIQKIMLMK